VRYFGRGVCPLQTFELKSALPPKQRYRIFFALIKLRFALP
jgi:hypothetical protein